MFTQSISSWLPLFKSTVVVKRRTIAKIVSVSKYHGSKKVRATHTHRVGELESIRRHLKTNAAALSPLLLTTSDSCKFYGIICSLDWSCLCSCYFSYILNFLRTSELTLPCDFKETELLRKEADFYQIEPLIQCLGDPKPLLHYPTDTYEEVVELSSTRKLSKYSNPVAVIITQLTITTKVSGGWWIKCSDQGSIVRLWIFELHFRTLKVLTFSSSGSSL